MFTFHHYIDENEVDSFLFHVQYDAPPPPEFFSPSSPLAHYSLYPDMFDNFVTPTTPLNPSNIYLDDHGYNQVCDGVIIQSEDEKFESIIHDLFNCKFFIS